MTNRTVQFALLLAVAGLCVSAGSASATSSRAAYTYHDCKSPTYKVGNHNVFVHIAYGAPGQVTTNAATHVQGVTCAFATTWAKKLMRAGLNGAGWLKKNPPGFKCSGTEGPPGSGLYLGTECHHISDTTQTPIFSWQL